MRLPFFKVKPSLSLSLRIVRMLIILFASLTLSLSASIISHSGRVVNSFFKNFLIFFCSGRAGNQHQPLGSMRFQLLGLPQHSFLCFQSLREPYPAITSRVFVFLYAFNVLFIFLFLSFSGLLFFPLSVYIISQVRCFVNSFFKIFLIFFGIFCPGSCCALTGEKFLNYQNLVKFRAPAFVLGEKEKALRWA